MSYSNKGKHKQDQASSHSPPRSSLFLVPNQRAREPSLYSQILPPEDEGSSYVAFPVYEDSIFPPEESYNKAHSDYSEAYSELFLEDEPPPLPKLALGKRVVELPEVSDVKCQNHGDFHPNSAGLLLRNVTPKKECSACGRRFTQRDEYRSHTFTHVDPKLPIYLCQKAECEKLFQYECNLNRHLRSDSALRTWQAQRRRFY